MRLPLFAAGGVVGVLAILAGCGSGDDEVPPNAVAKVGDTVIEKAEFDEQLERLARAESGGGTPITYTPPDFERCVERKSRQSGAPEGKEGKSEDDLREECEQDYERLRTQAMEFLIQQAWVRSEADEVGVDVTKAEARKELERQKDAAFKTAKEYRKFLETSGRTEADIVAEVATSMRQQRLTEKVTKGKTKPSAAEIEAYYAKNKKELGKPERRAVRLVITKTEAKAVAAKAALDAGQGWPAVAKEYSIDKASAAKGGLLPEVSETGDKKVDAALRSADVGVVSEPAKTQFGWWVFEVEKVKPAEVPPLTKVRTQVAQSVEQRKEQRLLDEFAEDFREEYRKQTICADDFKVASCANGPATNPTTSTPSMRQPQSEQDS